MWTALWYTFRKPRTLLTSGGLGTMGFGFPAALGAQAAWPDRLVIDIAGDGSIQMNIQELATVVQHKLPVKVLILNNGYLGLVRQWQELFYNKRYSHSRMDNPDFVKVAEAYGARGLRVTEPKDVHDGARGDDSNGRAGLPGCRRRAGGERVSDRAGRRGDQSHDRRVGVGTASGAESGVRNQPCKGANQN